MPVVGVHETDIVQESSDEDANVEDLVRMEPEVKFAGVVALGDARSVQEGASKVKGPHLSKGI